MPAFEFKLSTGENLGGNSLMVQAIDDDKPIMETGILGSE